MRWTIQHDEATGEWILAHNGAEVGRFATAQLAAAEVPADDVTGEDGAEFQVILCVEGVSTGEGDDRYLEVGGWSGRRTPPLTLLAQTELPEFGGHAGAFVAARIDQIERLSDGRRLWARGYFDSGEDGAEIARLVENQTLRFVSIDIGPCHVDYQVLAVDEEGWPERVLARFSDYDIMGATICAHPALSQAVIWLSSMDPPAELTEALPDLISADLPPEGADGQATLDVVAEISILASRGREGDRSALVASAVPVAPPRSWFDDPALAGPTPLAVEDDGRVYGHVAEWDCCHTGYPDRCLRPPRAPDGDYSAFMRPGQEVVCDDGSRVTAGPITVGGMHSDVAASAREATRHYDDVSLAAADVVVGEDQFGIWVAGALRPGVTPEQVRTLRASSPSGDWRAFDRVRGLELIAIHAVNTPGFPVARVASAAGDLGTDAEVLALVAGAGLHLTRHDEPALTPAPPTLRAELTLDTALAEAIIGRIELVEQAVRPLLPLAAEQLAAARNARVPSGGTREVSPLEAWVLARGQRV